MSTVLKWGLRVVGGIVVLLVVAFAVAYAVSERRVGAKYSVTPRVPPITSDSAVLARGEHLATAIAMCAECHGADFGGKTIADNAVVGTLAAPNLTTGRGGIGASYTDDDWVRSIRHGVSPDGRPFIFMPSDNFNRFSDADIAALVAYLKTVPAVHRETPATRLGPLGRVMIATGGVHIAARSIDHDAPPPVTPDSDSALAFGEHLASVANCKGCHGPDLSGGGGPPPGAANLTPVGLGEWTESDFVRAMRTGVRPDGRTLAESMPWRLTSRMTDEEIHALWLYLRSLPPSGKPRKA